MESVIKIDAKVVDEIVEHSLRHKELECGGYLLGNYNRSYDGQLLIINDIYKEFRVGEENTFVFATEYKKNAVEYANDTNQRIIGCYHSHGKYKAKFSKTDRFLELLYAKNNAALIYSPIENKLIGDIITTTKEVYESRITIINSNYIERLYYPKLPNKSTNKVLSLKNYQK